MRLFIGLSLPPEAQSAAAALAQSAQERIPGRYVPASNYHMTLAFLGDVPEARLDDAKRVLDAFAAQFSAPRLALGALSHFGKAANAILVQTVSSPDPLGEMHDRLLLALRAASLPVTDGPFSPHVTLARHADLSRVPPGEIPAPTVSFIAPRANLYLSARGGDNVLRYTPLYSACFRDFPSSF